MLVGDNKLQENSCGGEGMEHSGGDRLPHEECLDLSGRWLGTTSSKRILAVVGVRGIMGETGCLMRCVWICLDVGWGDNELQENSCCGGG